MQLRFIVKPVSIRCNLRCTYCYHGEQRRYVAEHKIPTMSMELVRKLTIQGAKLNKGRIKFFWHGGEPLLAGLDFYREVQRIQDETRGGRRIVNSLQTNGTLITREWADFFAENQWHLGVSLDGPREVHNTYRITATGKGSFDRVMRGITLLKEASVPLGLLAVVTRISLGKERELYEFFKSVSHTFDFSPYIVGPDSTYRSAQIAISPREWATFLRKVFDFWWHEDNPDIRVRTLRNAVQSALGRTPKICSYSGRCASYIAVDSNGDAYPCGRFVGHEEMRLGNLQESSLEEILCSEAYNWYIEKVRAEPDPKCRECKWFYACHGGCLYERYLGERQFRPRTSFCEAQKLILEHVSAKVRITRAAIGQ